MNLKHASQNIDHNSFSFDMWNRKTRTEYKRQFLKFKEYIFRKKNKWTHT